MTRSLYERLGGEDAIVAAVNLFYAKVNADERLSPWFAHLELDALIQKQIAFMTTAFGGPNMYSGRDLASAHAGLVRKGLGDAQFDAVVGHLKATLAELRVPEDTIAEVVELVDGTRSSVLAGSP